MSLPWLMVAEIGGGKSLRDWKNLFHKKILERGKEYFADGLVEQVEQTETGFHALVDGTDVYEVEVMLDGDHIYDMTCTCPFAGDGHYCKHMAEEELRDFVKRVVRNNPDMKSLLLTMYLPQIDAHQIVKLRAEVDDIVYRYGGRNGFIDYRCAWNFTSDMEDFLMNEFHDRDLLQKKLEMVDRDIAQMESSTDCENTWSAHYGYQNNILMRLELMKELDYTEEEIRQYRKKNWKFSAVRQLEIRELLETGSIQEASFVFRQSI